MRRSRTRDVAVCCLQMWAYLAAYKSPHDDPAAQERRVRIDYPIVPIARWAWASCRLCACNERWPGVGRTVPELASSDRVLVWTHWAWFMVPHGSLAYILVRHRGRFPRAAVMTYAVFDIGAAVYWLLPTAPPWYAASAAGRGVAERSSGAPPSEAIVEPVLRRMMVEYGEFFWQDGWGPLYSVFGGNPLAAMPSLHFATSLMAALLLAELGPIPGALSWGYTATLGFALVYLGEHYVVDLLAGAALTGAVRRLAPRAGPLCGRFRPGHGGA